MSTTTLLGLLSWGIALYLWRNGNRIRQTSMAIKGMQNPVFAPSLMSKIIYVLLGVLAGSALFVGVALADGADPFDHFQRILQAPVKIVPTPSVLSTATPTLMPSITPSSTLLPTPTGTLPAITPQTNATPASENDGGQGWEKTPNGQGQGQFQTPPGQGGVPPGQQSKPTNEPKPTKDNGGGNSKDNSSKSKP